MIGSPAFLLLALLCALIAGFGYRAQRAVRRAEAELSGNEMKIFRENYRPLAAQPNIPKRFEPLARARDRATRIWLIGTVAIIAALAWIIFAGPDLGL